MRVNMKFTIKELIDEVDYELSQRAKVYKRLIETKKMSRETAKEHYLKMQAIKIQLEILAPTLKSIEINKKNTQ